MKRGDAYGQVIVTTEKQLSKWHLYIHFLERKMK
jgi:hypothetical protein